MPINLRFIQLVIISLTLSIDQFTKSNENSHKNIQTHCMLYGYDFFVLEALFVYETMLILCSINFWLTFFDCILNVHSKIHTCHLHTERTFDLPWIGSDLFKRSIVFFCLLADFIHRKKNSCCIGRNFQGS